MNSMLTVVRIAGRFILFVVKLGFIAGCAVVGGIVGFIMAIV